MNNPKMIIFDYGQTLVDYKIFDLLKGTIAVLKEASKNPNNVSAEEVQALAMELNKDIGRFGDDLEKQAFLEVHNNPFQKYLYDYFDIEFTKSPAEIEGIFETSACTIEPTKKISEFLQFLEDINIRTSVISNISFSGDLLKRRIKEYIPSHTFEFIIASSEYVFRKPHKRIFEIALRKAKLNACDTWYCGDNAVYDVDGAAACHIFPVWFKGAIENSNKHVPKSDCFMIEDWEELKDKLKRGIKNEGNE